MSAPQNEEHIEEHSSFIQTPKQLITIIFLAFAVPIAVIAMLVSLVFRSDRFDAAHPAMSKEAIAERIKPVGQVQVGAAAAAGGKSAKSGQEVYQQVCAACHGSGVLNAPKVGDKAAWSKLIAVGLDELTADAIKGIRQMPARGGNPDLSDLEVQRAVIHMANQAGANWKEPGAGAAATTAAPPPAPAAAAPAATAAAPAEKPAAIDGKALYGKVCAVCHGAGVAGAPKTGDKAAWAPRLKQGMESLYASAIKGKGAMPAKGGAAQLSDAEVKAVVDYLAAQAK